MNERVPAAILFDFDGTIAETERFGHRVAYNEAFAQSGLDWVWGDALYGELLAVGGGKERIAFYLDHYRTDGEAYGDRAAFIAALHARKGRIFDTLVERIAFRPGVQRLVREAHAAGIRLGIATTAAASGVDALVARDPAFRDAFEIIAAGDVVPRKKPAPDIYRYALDRLGVAADQCIAVEDAEIGLRASRAAGITTLVTVSDYTRDHDFTGAAAVLSDLGEPGRPASTLAGPAPAHGVVDLEYLRELLETAPPGFAQAH
jgi:HAD superfamily hydrolase (TIGR01509 family)